MIVKSMTGIPDFRQAQSGSHESSLAGPSDPKTPIRRRLLATGPDLRSGRASLPALPAADGVEGMHMRLVRKSALVPAT